MSVFLLLAALVAAILGCSVRAPRGLRLAPAVLGLLVLTVDCWQGWRWQQLPTGLGFGLLLLLSWWQPRRRRRVTAVALAAALTATGVGAAWALPRLPLPQPSGDLAVGTTVVQWVDPERGEPATEDPHDRRVVVAQLWYPAAADPPRDQRAWYFGITQTESQQVAAGMAQLFGLPSFLLDGAAGARTRAGVDVPAHRGQGRWPVVLFSPGLTGVRTQNTLLSEDLASHGYLVVAVDHPYDSAAVVLRDGRIIRSRVGSTGDADQDASAAEDATRLRADDLRFVLTQLERGAGPSGAETATRVIARADTDRVATVGHSLGGAAAVRAASLDPRVDAAVMLDSYPWTMPDVLADPDHNPPPTLALVAGRGLSSPEADARYAGALAAVLEAADRPSYRTTVTGAGHLSVTDAPLFLPPGVAGGLPRARVPVGVAAATRSFLDTRLRGAPDDEAARRLAALGAVTTYPG